MITTKSGDGSGSLVWMRVAGFSGALFFVFFSDAILSYWVPVFLQGVLMDATQMGLVFSFSSFVGLVADLTIPQLLKGLSVRKLILLAIVASMAFGWTLLFTTWWPLLSLMLLSMGIWGIYYEALAFANMQFVSDTVPVRQRSGAWAIIGTFKSLAYFLGPILASRLMLLGDRTLVAAAMGFVMIGLLSFIMIQRTRRRRVAEEQEQTKLSDLSLLREFEHWVVLFKHVWPILILSLMIGVVDAVFWTTGAVFNEQLAKQSWWGGMFLPFYILPSMFVGFWVVKWGVYRGKKKMAEKFMLLSGFFLTGLAVGDYIPWVLAMVLGSSIFGAMAHPLLDAVYSDVVARMGRERKHMIGLSSSMISTAYVVGPILAGLIADGVGERMTFVVIGGGVAVVSFVLLLVTPRKLLLPSSEIKTWT